MLVSTLPSSSLFDLNDPSFNTSVGLSLETPSLSPDLISSSIKVTLPILSIKCFLFRFRYYELLQFLSF
ncbi:hypothetical protein LguiB_021682 [Lonicera macranthoides]